MAGRISNRCVARDQSGLAAAAAKVQFAEFAIMTRLRQPLGPAKAIERFRFAPNPRQRFFADVIKAQGFDFVRGRAGEHFAGRIHREMFLPPAVHAGFRPVAIVIRDDKQNFHFAEQTFFGGGGNRHGGFNLLARRQQQGAVFKSPTVILRVGQFQSLRAQTFGEPDDLFQALDIGAMQNGIDRQRHAGIADHLRGQ